MDAAATAFGTGYVLLLVFLLILAILWLLMPFAIFGTKDLLREQNRELSGLREEIKDLNKLLAQHGKASLDELRRLRLAMAADQPSRPAGKANFDAEE